jgi:hypothetical protein
MSTERKWLRLDKEWRKVLAEFQVPYFHMNELSPRLKGPYKLWPSARRDAFIRKLVWLCTAYIDAWSGITVDVNVYSRFVPTDRKKRLHKPYFHALESCISSALIYCEMYGITDKITFVIDDGAVSSARRRAF